MTPVHPREEAALSVEPDEIPRRPLAVIVGVAAVITVAGIFVARALLVAGTPYRSPAPAVAAPEIGIVEQTLIRSTRRGLDERLAHRKSLERFGWVDRGRGIAEIPIDDAMDLVADPAFLQKVEQATERAPARTSDRGP